MDNMKNRETGTTKLAGYLTIAVLLAFALRTVLNFGSMSMEAKALFVAVYAIAIGGLYLIFR